MTGLAKKLNKTTQVSLSKQREEAANEHTKEKAAERARKREAKLLVPVIWRENVVPELGVAANEGKTYLSFYLDREEYNMREDIIEGLAKLARKEGFDASHEYHPPEPYGSSLYVVRIDWKDKA